MLYNYFKHGKLEPSEGRGIAEGVGQTRITKNLEGAPIDDAIYVARPGHCQHGQWVIFGDSSS